MQYEKVEICLNDIVQDLFSGLNVVAAKVREGASAADTADSIEALARVICDHWPDCLQNNPNTAEAKSQCSPKAS